MSKVRNFTKTHKWFIPAIVVVIIVAIIAVFAITKSANASVDGSLTTATLERTDLTSQISTSGKIEPQNSRNIVSNAGKRITAVNVKVGDVVHADDVLATLDAGSANDDVQAAQLSVDMATNTLKLSTQAIDSGLQNAKLTVANAQNEYDNAKRLLDNFNPTSATPAAPDKPTLQYSLNRADIALQQAQVALSTASQKNTSAEKLALEQSKITLDKAQIMLEEFTIKAPADGTITQTAANVGDFATGTLFVIDDLTSLKIDADLSEYDIANIKEGQTAIIKTDATGSESFAGVVTNVAKAATVSLAANSLSAASTATSAGKFSVEVSLETADPRLKVGMNTRITIVTDSKQHIFAVPFDSLKQVDDLTTTANKVLTGSTESSRYLIYVIKDGQPEPIEVETGIESDVAVEIKSDQLEEGMEYATAPQDVGLTEAQRRMNRMKELNG